MRAAIYTRISQDRKVTPEGQRGDGAGVQRQEQECRDLIKNRGWTLTQVYTDNDISAFTGKVRPQYRDLIKAMNAGEVDVVVAWHTDRLYRRLRDLSEFVDVCQQQKVSVATVRAGDIDLGTAAGRMMAKILGSVAEAESEQKSERLRAQRVQAARAGKWNGGPRTFGFTTDMAVEPAEADVIREIAERLLSGDSLRSVVGDLNRRQVPTCRGGAWRPATVRHMIASARLSGQREHTPRAEGRGYGFGEIVSEGRWSAILTKTQTARLRQLLGDPSRRTYRPSQRLLSAGVLRCGRCGEPMNSRTVAASAPWRYACIKHPGTKRCGGMSVVGGAVDDLITDMVLQAISGARIAPTKAADATGVTEMHDEIVQHQRRLETMAGDYAEGLITRSEWFAARHRVEERVKSLRHQMPRPDDRRVLDGLPTELEALINAWSGMHLDRQRAVVAAVVERVEVRPATKRGRPTFDSARIEVVWRA